MRLFRDFPFATTFALAGFFVGISILFSLDIFVNYKLDELSGNFIESLLNYFKDSLSKAGKALLSGVLLGSVLGLIFGTGGFIIDYLKRSPDSKILYTKRSQRILGNV